MRAGRLLGATASFLLVASACSTGGSSLQGSGAGSSTSASSRPGSAQATLSFVGMASLSGGLSRTVVRCQYPSTSGDDITLSGYTPDGSVSVYLTVSTNEVGIRLVEMSGSTVFERDFDGSGVTGFDAARGATISGALTESTPAGTPAGSIGELTSLSGSIDCAGQQRGTASIQLTGTLPEGSVDGQIESARVECDKQYAGVSIDITGLVSVGGSHVLATMTIDDGQFTLFLGTSPNFYDLTANGPGTGTIAGSDTGTVNGDATGAGSGGGASQKVHATGSATCGSTIS